MANIGRRSILSGAGLLAVSAACRPRQDPYTAAKPAVALPWRQRAGGETEILSTCGLCAAGCGIRVRVVEGHAVKVDGSPHSPVNRGRLCARGQAALELLYHPDRVRGPLRRAGDRGEDRWHRLIWDEALAQLGAELRHLRAAGAPQSLVVLDGESAGVTHALWARFLRAFGSPNHIGHGATGCGATARVMAAACGAADLPGYDFEHARLALLVGTGALESSAQAMHLARALASGARPRLLCAWPRLPPSAALVDEWLSIAPGSQASLLLGLAHVLLREGLAEEDAVAAARGYAQAASGSEQAQAGLRGRIMAGFAPEQVALQTGLPARRIEQLARELASARPSLVAVDETANDDATAAAGLVLNALLGGLVGTGGLRLGAAPSPDFGEVALDATAAQGLRHAAIDGRDAGAAFADSRILAVPGAIAAARPYPVQALMLAHSNPVHAKPAASRWQQALAKVPLVVSFSPLFDESARFADWVLPDHTFLEAWDVVAPGQGMEVLSLRQPVVRPRGNTLQTGDAILRLAAVLGGAVAQALPWDSYRQATLAGLARAGCNPEQLMPGLESDGVWSPPAAASAEGRSEERRRRIYDVSAAVASPAPSRADDGAAFPFVLVPFRGPGYCAGGTGHLPWLAELPMAAQDPWQPRIEISPFDARELGITDGERVVVVSPFARVVMLAQVHEGVRPGVLGLPLGGGAWPVASTAANPSALLADAADAKTGQWLACATRARIGRIG
jgi:menaquinone reductase, molybdopterin-binding-like subunit